MRTIALKYRKHFSKPGCRSILPGKLTCSVEIRYYGLTGTDSTKTAQPWQWSPDQHLALLYRTSGHQFFSSELPLQFWNAARSLWLCCWDVKTNRQGWLGVGGAIKLLYVWLSLSRISQTIFFFILEPGNINFQRLIFEDNVSPKWQKALRLELDQSLGEEGMISYSGGRT